MLHSDIQKIEPPKNMKLVDLSELDKRYLRTPVGRYSSRDIEQILNNAYDTTQQEIDTMKKMTSLKSFYGFNFIAGIAANSSGVMDKWIPFGNPIPGIVNVKTQFIGISPVATPTGITETAFSYFTAQPAIVMAVAGISDAGFSARITSAQEAAFDAGTFFHTSSYVFTWEAVAQVK